MAKVVKSKFGNKPLEKLRQGNVEVVVWSRLGRGGKPFRTHTLTRYSVDYEKRSMTWSSLNGLTCRDLHDLKQLISDALEGEIAGGEE